MPGGVTIDVSLKIVGAGAGSTVIRGGSSVLTIGVYGAATEPTVSIAGVTITGGLARSSPVSILFSGADGVVARGGGVEIPPNADFTGGATVTISNSVITGNRVAPTHALPEGPPCPGDVKCPFAQAAGGGVDSWGTLTLTNTKVSNNHVGTASGLSTVASDADGGAIANELGPLTINNSTISGNEATASAPNGRFADSGALLLEGGTVTMTNSTVTDNTASLAASEPNSVAANNKAIAIAGAIHVEDGVTAATIRNTTISGNSASMTNTVGDATAFSGGLHTDGVFTLNNDNIANNSIYSATLPPSTGDAEGDSAAGEMAGTISNTRLAGNTVTVRSASGTAIALAGATIVTGTLTNSVVSANHVFASSPTGNVVLAGGGLQMGGPLTLQNTTVRRNTGHATGLRGSAQGGGNLRRRPIRHRPAARRAADPHQQPSCPQPAQRKPRHHAPRRRHRRHQQPRHPVQQPDRRQQPRPMRRLLTQETQPTTRPPRDRRRSSGQPGHSGGSRHTSYGGANGTRPGAKLGAYWRRASVESRKR